MNDSSRLDEIGRGKRNGKNQRPSPCEGGKTGERKKLRRSKEFKFTSKKLFGWGSLRATEHEKRGGGRRKKKKISLHGLVG